MNNLTLDKELMFKAIKEGNWQRAAYEIENSALGNQTKERAKVDLSELSSRGRVAGFKTKAK